MAKQLNVNMKFNADTSEARAQIQALQQSLKDISKMPGNPFSLFDDSQLKKASQAALELQTHLQRAVNINTGKLDLSRFASSLKASNKDLSSYTNTLLSVGQQGQQAFLQLANAIAAADTPTTRINAKLADLGTTLKNTAKWQISSSVLHGFMGAVQSAYGYAQDLNESLNNIRIVTGQNIDQMAKFAETANRAAKALSTTTTDYTNASLIYYQQGLDDSQVQERTDITIKMANVARQSAEVVSDQMTAVWNNFDDGSKSLEYYADVMTALGAATASSTDEIAAGLEKFAAVSETVGLSYEYATAALATVTDKTRQSADVVGTAFKTMFARIQGLKLGETLEDGTDFNQYSEALLAVGVNIKDANGELKDMDNILNEMAAVWETLNRDEQVALAQKVAGVRQYNQLMSLMENWDAMEMNLGVVETSEGALQEQADIYAESWEAAQDRVRAAAEGIYQDLIDDEFFIDLLNGFEKLLEGINGVVQGFGGMKGVITAVGGLFLSYYANKMPDTLNNFKQNMMVFTGQAKKEMDILQQQTSKKLGDITAEDSGYSKAYKIEAEGINKVIAMKQSLIAKSRQLTSEQRAHYEATIDNVEAIYKEVVALQKAEDAAEKKLNTSKKDLAKSGSQGFEKLLGDYQKAEERTSKYEQKTLDASDQNNGVLFEQYDALFQKSKANTAELEMEVSSLLKAYGLGADEVESFMTTLRDEHKLTADQMAQLKQIVQTVSDEYSEMVTQAAVAESVGTSTRQQAQDWKMVAASMKEGSTATDEMKSKMKLYISELKNLSKVGGFEELNTDFDNFMKDIDEGKFTVQELADKFEALEKIVSSSTSAAKENAEDKIGTLDKRMDDMKFDPEARKGMQENANKLAESQVKTIQGWQNGRSAAEDMAKSTFHLSTALTEFAGTAMSVYSVVMTLKSAFQTFGDEDASAFEKIGAAMSILMAVTSAYAQVKQFSTMITSKDTKIAWANTVATVAGTAAKGQETKGLVVNTAAWIKNALGISASAAAIAAITGYIVAVIAILAALTIAIKQVSAAYNADKNAAEGAAKSARELAEEYENTKSKYEEMIATMENYETARAGLDNLTEGAEGYREKLNEANEQALKLIELLGLIKDEGYTVENGQIIIDKQSDNYKNAIISQEKKMQDIYNAKIMSQASASEAAAKYAQTKLVRKDDSKNLMNNVSQAVGASTNTGNPMENLIISLFGLAKGVVSNIDQNKEEQERIDQLTEAYKKLGETAFIDLESFGFDTANKQYIEAIKEQVRVNVQAANDLATAAETVSNAIIKDNEFVQNSGYSNDIEAVGAKTYKQDYEKEYKDALEKMKTAGGIATEDYKTIVDNYLDSLGINKLDGFRVDNYTDSGIEYSYIGEDGARTDKEISTNTIASYNASNIAAQNLTPNSNELVNLFSYMDASGIDHADALSTYITEGNLDKLTLNDFIDFENASFDNEDFIKKLNSILQDGGVLKALGVENAHEFISGFTNTFNSAKDNFEGLEGFQDKTYGEATRLNNIAETVGLKGEDGQSQLLDYYNGLNEEEQKIFLELDFDKLKTKENWDAAIAEIKEEKLEIDIETASNAEASKYNLDSAEVSEMADVFADYDAIAGQANLKTEEAARLAAAAASRYIRLQDAVLDLSENYDDYARVLKDVRNASTKEDRLTIQRTENYKKLKTSLAGLLGTTEDLIDADLMKAIDPKDFDKASRGDEAAIERIRDAFIRLQAEANNIDFEGLNSELDSLKEGVVFDISADETPFLNALIQAKVNAGAGAAEIRSLLQGFDIDADVTDFCGSMQQMATASADAATAVIANTSFSQEVETVTAENKTNKTDIQWVEKYTPIAKTAQSQILKDGAEELEPVTETYQQWEKTVEAKPVTEQASEEVQGTSVNTTNAAGQSGNVKGVQIKNAHKSNGSSVGNSTRTGANGNRNSGGGGGGGGGGGSAPKPAKKVKKTKKTDVVDRYKEITDSLDDNTKALEKAGKKADYLYGPGRIKWLKESNKLIKEQNNLLKSQIRQAKTNLTLDRTDLDKAASALDIDFSYDKKTGNILNYTTEMNKVFEQLSKAEDTINSFKTQDQQDKYKEETLQPLQDKIEELKEAQAQYDETKDLIETLNIDLEDNLRELENNKSAMISHVIELKVKVDDEDLSHLDFLISRLEAREFRTAKLLTEMQGYLGIYQNQADTAKDGMDRYLNQWLTAKEKKLFDKGRADEIDWVNKENLPDDFWDKIIEYANDYREATQSAFELRTEMYDKLGSAFSDLTSEIDDTISKFDHYSQVMDSYTNIIDLSRQKNLFAKEDLKEFNQLKVTNANAKLESSKNRKESYATYAADRKSEYEADLQRRKDIKEELEFAEGESKKQLKGELEAIEQQIKLSKQAWQDAEDAALTANEEFLASWEEALQASRDAFLANVQLELDALEEKMAGTYGSIENMQQDFDRNAEINDRYLEDYERIYELSKMTRDLDKKIDETSNIKAKKELAKLQEEILFYQEEGRKMSDYDLEYLQKKYDLRVAEIAMEEAQNAKTQVRLTRDSEGNYSYTYTADEDSMAKAQQTYEDKLYELTNLSNEHIEEQTGQLLQTQQEYLDALAEIHQKAAEGQYKTTEDYQKALDECTAYYVGKMNYHGGEIDKATMNNAIVYKSDYSNYERYVGDKLTESQKLVNKTDAQILENQKLMTVLTVEKQAALDEVHLAFARGLIENETEYTTKIGDIEEDYDGRLLAQQGKIKDLIKDRDDLYAKDYGSYSDAAIKKEAAEKSFVTNIKDKWLPQLEDTQSTGEGYVKSFADAIAGPGGYLESVKNEYTKLSTNIDSNMTSAGTSTKDFAADVKKDLLTDKDSVKKSIDKTSKEVDKLITKLTGENGLTKTAKGLHTWALDVNSDIGILIKKYKDLQKAVQNAQTALRDQSEQELDEEPDRPTTPQPSSEGNKNEGDGVAKVGDEVTYVSGLYYYDSVGTAPAGSRGQGKKATITQIKSGAPYPIHLYSTDSAYGWVKKSQISGYDTGGYTGNWGSEGKLAMLHEKELVLNKQDTENMLKIISMVRDLSNVLDMQAYQASLAQLQANHLYHVNSPGEIFEQTVTIHAEFPEAIYANEIEVALSNLVNNASQYANRKY